MSESARFNMVEGQLRTNAVSDSRVLAAIGAVAREKFVPDAYRALAYADVPVEVAPGRFLLDPRSFAKLLQLAEVTADDRVLDVGTATGYSAAVLARLAGSVVALEQDANFIRDTSELLENSVGRVELVQGSLIDGFKSGGPYDVIFINGAIEAIPEALLDQLADGGRLITVMREDGQTRAQLFLNEQGRIGRRADFDADVPPLAGFKKRMGFAF